MTPPHIFPPAPPLRPRTKSSRPAPRGPAPLLVLLTVAAALGCNELWPGERRVVGHIDFGVGGGPGIPETATASVPQVITFHTYGGGCHEGGETEVDIDGQTAVVTPYDYLDVPLNGTCTLVLRSFEHKAIVTFRRPGAAKIVVRYSSDADKPSGDERREYAVEVSPAR